MIFYYVTFYQPTSLFSFSKQISSIDGALFLISELQIAINRESVIVSNFTPAGNIGSHPFIGPLIVSGLFTYFTLLIVNYLENNNTVKNEHRLICFDNIEFIKDRMASISIYMEKEQRSNEDEQKSSLFLSLFFFLWSLLSLFILLFKYCCKFGCQLCNCCRKFFKSCCKKSNEPNSNLVYAPTIINNNQTVYQVKTQNTNNTLFSDYLNHMKANK